MTVSKVNQQLKFLLMSLVVLGVLTSCNQKTFETNDELIAYLIDEENGYTQTKSVNGIDFSVTYRPTDLVVQQMLGENPTGKEIDSLRKMLDRYMYLNLSLANNDKEILNGLATNSNQFGMMVNQLAFGMAEKVNLFSNKKDTIPLVDYIYPRLYGLGGGNKMLFVYEKDDKIMEDDSFHITVEDLGLMTGEIGFKIPTKLIKNQPSLEF